jgi:hypothetical protein
LIDDSHELAFFGLNDEHGFADDVIIMPASIASELSGFGSCLSSSIDDSHELSFFGLDDEHGIHVVTEDLIPIESSRLGSRLLSLDGDLFEHDHGITPVSIPSDVVTHDSIPSKPPDGLGSRLSSSTDDLFERDHGITSVSIPSNVVTGDSIPSKPPDGLGSFLSSLAGDLFERDNGINPVSIPSWPTRLGSCLSSSANDLFENDHGINPGSADNLIKQSVTKLEMGRLRGFNTFHDKGSGTTLGEQSKKISRSSCACMQEAQPDSICSVCRGVTRFPYVDNVMTSFPYVDEGTCARMSLSPALEIGVCVTNLTIGIVL